MNPTAKKLHYNFHDPAKAIGSEEEIMDQFRSARDQVKAYAHDFVQVQF